MIYKERGRIIEKLPVQSGTSKTGSTWSKMDMVFETEDAKFPKKICATFFGEKADQLSKLNAGDRVDVSFTVESREFGGKYYHNINAVGIDAVVGESGVSDLKSAPQPNFTEPEEDDLPF